jgi:hypothetical protein
LRAVLRGVVRSAIERHMDGDAFEALKVAEKNERQQLTMFARRKRRR